MSGRRYRVATIVGSLRRRSYNRSLMQTAMLVAPEHISLFEIAIDRLPFFDEVKAFMAAFDEWVRLLVPDR